MLNDAYNMIYKSSGSSLHVVPYLQDLRSYSQHEVLEDLIHEHRQHLHD